MLVSVLLWLLVLPVLAWAVVRLSGWERGLAVQLFAFTPYVAAAAVLPLLFALVTRRWLTAAVAAVAAAMLIVCVLPRVLPDHNRGPQTGVALRVMTANMFVGVADPATIVALVRDNDIAVLALQEYTASAKAGLTRAGLDQLLPYSSLGPASDPFSVNGSALYSRFPVAAAGIRQNGGGFQQAYGTIQPPGAAPLTVESAHPVAPSSTEALGDWKADLAAEPAADQSAAPRILLGDFNSTLDHAALRSVIQRNYRDAADADGKGLVPTWGPYTGHPIPPVTIDHVLVDQRIGVTHVAVHGLPGSDHRAVMAALWVPVG